MKSNSHIYLPFWTTRHTNTNKSLCGTVIRKNETEAQFPLQETGVITLTGNCICVRLPDIQ